MSVPDRSQKPAPARTGAPAQYRSGQDDVETADLDEGAERTVAGETAPPAADPTEIGPTGNQRVRGAYPAHRMFEEVLYAEKYLHELAAGMTGPLERQPWETELDDLRLQLDLKIDQRQRELQEEITRQYRQALERIKKQTEDLRSQLQAELTRFRQEKGEQQARQDKDHHVRRMREVFGEVRRLFEGTPCFQQFVTMIEEGTPEAKDAYFRAFKQRNANLVKKPAGATREEPRPRERDSSVEEASPVSQVDGPASGVNFLPDASPADLAAYRAAAASTAPQDDPFLSNHDLTVFQSFQEAHKLRDKTAELAAYCRDYWPEAVDRLVNLRKTLECFPIRLRGAADAPDSERQDKARTAALDQASHLITDLCRLDILVALKYADPKDGRGWVIKFFDPPKKKNAENTLKMIRDLRTLLYDFEKKHGAIEECNVPLNAPVHTCGQVEIVSTVDSGRSTGHGGDLFVAEIVQCGYMQKLGGWDRVLRPPRIIASKGRRG